MEGKYMGGFKLFIISMTIIVMFIAAGLIFMEAFKRAY